MPQKGNLKIPKNTLSLRVTMRSSEFAQDTMAEAVPMTEGVSATTTGSSPKSNAPSAMVAAARARGTLVAPVVLRLCSSPVRLADLCSLTVAIVITLFSSSLEQGQSPGDFLGMRISVRNLLVQVALLCTWRLIFWIAGMYQPRLNRTASTFLWRVPLAVLACTAILSPLLLIAHQPPPDVLRAGFTFWFAGTTLMFASRASYFTYDEYVRPHLRKMRTVIVVGTGPRARIMVSRLMKHPDYRYQICGFVDSAMQPECKEFGVLLGSVAELEAMLMRQPIDEVVIALPIKSAYAEIAQVVEVCGDAGIQTQYSLELFTSDIAKHQAVDETTGVRVMEMVHNDHRLLLKSALDRILAFTGLLLLSPVLLVLATLVKFTSKGPVFFVQQRFGQNKRMFGMIKFRSMVVDAEARQAALEKFNEFGGPMFKMKNDPRITPIGRFIRKTSLDELPQLINVLKGDMSLVGPRPLPTRDVERFEEPWLMRRFSVKPGITGLWQVSGRSSTDFDATIALDLKYIDRWSMLLDLKILLRTFSAVMKGRGAY